MSRITLIVLCALLMVAATGVFLYERELSRQADQRCDELHRSYDPHSLSRFNIEAQLKKTCGGLTDDERAADLAQKQKSAKEVREMECEDTLRREGPDSTNARKYCSPETLKAAGKK